MDAHWNAGVSSAQSGQAHPHAGSRFGRRSCVLPRRMFYRRPVGLLGAPCFVLCLRHRGFPFRERHLSQMRKDQPRNRRHQGGHHDDQRNDQLCLTVHVQCPSSPPPGPRDEPPRDVASSPPPMIFPPLGRAPSRVRDKRGPHSPRGRLTTASSRAGTRRLRACPARRIRSSSLLGSPRPPRRASSARPRATSPRSRGIPRRSCREQPSARTCRIP